MATRMKGTFFFKMGTGGWTESLYAVIDTSKNYKTMMSDMDSLLNLRCKLSITGDFGNQPKPWCLNPVNIQAIRVEDETLNKDAFTTLYAVTPTGYPTNATDSALLRQNLYQDEAAKIQWNGANPGEQSVTYLHGIPVKGADDNPNDINATSLIHDAEMSTDWLSALSDYAHAIRQKGLGFRRLVTYDTTKETYTFTMPQAAPKLKMRYVLRGFKSLNFLNGRRAGLMGTGNTITLLGKWRQQAWDGLGYVSPEVWAYFIPNETQPANPAQLPGAKFFFITSKKIGRPFELPRGRARVKPR